MDIVGSKVVVLVLLGALKISAGLLPIILTKYLAKRRKLKCLDKFIGLVLCIGGGILLSTVFIHMIKEVRETLDAAMKKGIFKDKDLEYPFAELLICMGFLLIFLIESIVHKFFGGHGHGHGTPINKTKPVEFEVGGSVPAGLDNQAFAEDLPQSTSTPSTLKRIVSGDNSDSRPQTPKLPFAAGKIKGTGKNVYNVSSATLTSYASFDAESMSMSTPTTAKGNFVGSTNSLQSDNSIAREKSFLSSVRGFLIVLALSIHSLFEGMAIGLEETDSGVWKLFAAVIVHGVAIVFCIGTEMISSGLKKKTILIYMLVLGVNSPVGVLIGLIVTLQIENPSGGHLLAIGVLQGLAGGTLLYITFFEVLSREKLTKYNMTGLTGILAIAFGFTLMAVMEGAGGHNHSHGGGSSLEHADHSGHNHGGHNHGGVKQLWQGEEDGPRLHLGNNPFKNSDQHFHPKHGYDDLSNEGHDHEQHDHDDHFHEHKDNDSHDHKQHDHDDHNHEQHDHEYHDHEQHDHDDHDHEQHDHDDHDHRHQDVDHSDGDHDHNHDELENDHDHDHDHQHQDDHARERHENDHYVENHDHQHDHGNAADYHNELEHIHGDDVHEHEGHNHDEHKDYANEHNHNDTALDVRSKAVKKQQERGRSLSDHDHQHGNQNHEHDHVDEAHIHDVHNDLHHEENHVHHGIALNGHDPTHDNKTVYHEHDVHKDHQDNHDHDDHDDHDLEENAHENHTEMHHEHDSNKNHAERHEDLVHDNHTETHHVHDIYKDSHHAHAHDTDSDHNLESHNDHDNITDSDHDHVHDHADSTDSHHEHDHGNLSDSGNFHGVDNHRESHSDHDPNDHIEDHDEHAHGHNHKVMPKIMAESAVDYEDLSDHEGHIEGSHHEGLDHDLDLHHIQEEMGHDHEHQNNKEEISHDHDHQNSQEEMDHDHDHQNSREAMGHEHDHRHSQEEMGHEHDHRHSQEEMDHDHDHQISQEELVHEDGHVHNHGEGRDEHAGDNVDGSEHNHDDHEHSEPIQIAEKSANINGTNKNSGFLANVADFLG